MVVLPEYRLSRRSLLLASLVCPFGSAQAGGATRQSTVFVIARSLNANVVHYDARWDGRGSLDRERPLIAYWVMHAEDHRLEELSWFERQFAYGWSVASESPQQLTLRLTAFPERSVAIRIGPAGKPQAYVKIAQRDCILQRIFVRLEDDSAWPSVRYVELSGTDALTGTRVRERLEAP
jgi:hypothetical protein